MEEYETTAVLSDAVVVGIGMMPNSDRLGASFKCNGLMAVMILSDDPGLIAVVIKLVLGTTGTVVFGGFGAIF